MLSALIFTVSLAFANPNTEPMVLSGGETMTESVCSKLRKSYTSMGSSVATLAPFETGKEFSVLTVQGESWFVEHTVSGNNPANLWWNTSDPYVSIVELYIHPYDMDLKSADSDYDPDSCVVQYRRTTYQGNHAVELGRVDVTLYAVEKIEPVYAKKAETTEATEKTPTVAEE